MGCRAWTGRGPWAVVVSLLVIALAKPAAGQMRDDSLQGASDRAVKFLATAQQANGAFLLEACTDEALRECQVLDVTFPTAFVIEGLAAVDHPQAAALIAAARGFLRTQADDQGLFRAATKASPSYAAELPHLGITCLNRFALEPVARSEDPVVPRLLIYQTIRGFFYSLAISPRDVEALRFDATIRAQFQERHGASTLAWAETIDPVINGAIMRYLVTRGTPSDSLCAYLVEQASRERPDNPFGGSPYLLAALVSESFRLGASCLADAAGPIQSRVLAQQGADGSWGSVVDTALALTTLMNLGYEGPATARAVQALVEGQQSDGSWKRAVWSRVEAFGISVGSEAVSTAFVLRALGQYQRVSAVSPS